LGIMAAMKVNMFKMADKLKYGYLTKEEAQKLNMDIDEWEDAVKSLHKVEKLFCDVLQGKKGKLKNAILWGKRKKNFNQRLTDAEMSEIDNAKFDEKEIASSKEVQGIMGLGVVTAAAGGAAAAVSTPFITKIWNMVKGIKIKNLFKRNPEKQALFDKYGKEEGKRLWKAQKEKSEKAGNFVKGDATIEDAAEIADQTSNIIQKSDQADQTETSTTTEANENQKENKGMIASLVKNKVVIVGTALAVAGGAIYLFRKKRKKSSGVSGVRRRKSTKRTKRRPALHGLDGVKRRKTQKSLPARTTSTRKNKPTGTRKRKTTRKATTRRRVSSIKLK